MPLINPFQKLKIAGTNIPDLLNRMQENVATGFKGVVDALTLQWRDIPAYANGWGLSTAALPAGSAKGFDWGVRFAKDIFGRVHLEGLLYKSGVAPTWNNLTFQNGWASYKTVFGGDFGLGRYRLDVDGWVTLTGLLTGGTVTTGTVLTTLPVGFRPADRLVFTTSKSADAAGTVWQQGIASRLDVWPNGDITLVNVAQTFVSLDGIRFYVGVPASNAPSTTAFTLPVGFRPRKTLTFQTYGARLQLLDNGDMRVVLANSDSVGFHGVSFQAYQ